MANQSSFNEQFFRGIQAADQEFDAQRKRKNDAEDRKLDMERRTLELKALKLQEKVAARQEAMQNAQLMQGQPAQRQPVSSIPMPSFEPSIIGKTATQPVALSQQLPHAPVTIPGVTGPDTTVQPQTFEELFRRNRDQQTFEAGLKEPRNIDPLSPQGIAASIALRQATAPEPQQIPGRDVPLPPDVEEQRRRMQPPRATTTTSEPLVQTVDEQGNLVYTPRSQAAGQRAPNTRQNPGQAGQSEYSRERATRVLQDIATLKGQITAWTTGFGSLLDKIPTTAARTFKAQLDTLKANIAFNELTAMREASKTGGALGQVSNRELELLQSALGALDTGQPPSALREQLDKIEASIQRWQKEAASAPAPAPSGSAGDGKWKVISVK